MKGAPPTKHSLLEIVSDVIGAVDERAADVNRKWGHNRLPLLVPFDWCEKFRSQKRKFELACFECTFPDAEKVDRVRKHGDGMLKAFDKLESLAVEAGYLPTPPSWWEFELADGTPVLLVRTRAEMSQVDPQGRTAQIWSLEEVADMIEKFPKLVLATKDAFPGAEVIQCRTNPLVIGKLDDELSDLPF